MSSWICVISDKSPRNWSLCKEVNLYGIATYNRKIHQIVQENDILLFWFARNGFLAYGKATSESRPPIGIAEVPWAGGIQRFSIVVPFKVEYEPIKPIFVPFVGGKQIMTGIGAYTLQRGFASITDFSALEAKKLIRNPSLMRKPE